MVEVVEQPILDGRRAFSKAQQLLGSEPTGSPVAATFGWHDTAVHPETGSFAVVALGSGLDYLIGTVIRVTFNGRRAFVYVLGARAVPVDVSVCRNVFVRMDLLARESADGFFQEL